jgi:hypothetical protein
MALAVLVVCILLLGFGVNLGFWSYKKVVVADAAEAIVKAAIKNQLTYREAGNPSTRSMIDDMVADLALADRLHTVTIGYEFGVDDGSGFVSVGGDPDPKTTPFNAVRLQLCTPLDDITGSFTLGNEEACVQAEASFTVSNDCRCNYMVCPTTEYSGLGRTLCLLGCVVGSALRGVLELLFTLNLAQLLIALDCVLDSLVVSLNTTFVWLLGPEAAQLEYHRYT